MKIFLPLLFIMLIFVGCAEKKVDVAQLTKANELVAAGNFEQGVATLDELAKTSPNDDALKQARIEGHLIFERYFMFNDSLPPKQKYGPALKEYRAVVAIDPKNSDAQNSIALIEGIYKEMGRPIPQ